MTRHFIYTWMFVLISYVPLLAQQDSTFHLKGIVSVTNNGFSTLPVFSLGKPAASLDLMIGNKRFSFEPQFRFSLDGKPWIFNFIYRYKLINKTRYQVVAGSYLPALNFVNRTIINNGGQQDLQTVRRFLAADVSWNYRLKQNITIDIYYFRAHGLQADGPNDLHYLALRNHFNKIKLTHRLFIDFHPQLYYLKVDTQDGFYANATIRMGLKDFPVSISGIVNKSIRSEVPAKNFDWNIGIQYLIERRYPSHG